MLVGGPEGDWELTACVAGLQNVQCSSHVSLAQFNQRICGLRTDMHTLLHDHLVDQNPDILLHERTESKSRATTEKRWT